MNRFNEMVTASLGAAITLSTGISSSSLLDMRDYDKAIFTVVASKPIDATTANFPITVTIYDSTASTWNGAVAGAVSGFQETATCNSQTAGFKVMEIRADQMGLANNKRYIGCHVAAWTKTDIFVVVERYRGNYDPQS